MTFSTVRRRAVLMSCVGLTISLAACDACSSRPPPPPPVTAEDAGILELAPIPEMSELIQLEERALAGLAVGAGAAFRPAYTIPTCSVRYELRSQYLAEVAPGREPAGMEVVVELVGNPDTDRLTWQMLSMRTFFLNEGEREERPYGVASWPPALVRSDGERFVELAGPSTLWSAFTAIPPLLSLFPRLPPDLAIDVSYPWKVESFNQRTTSKVEQRREDRPDAGVPNLTPNTYDVQVTPSAWRRLASDRRSTDVLLLTAEWSTERSEIEPTESQRAERWRARYLVAANGRLVYLVAAAGRYQYWQPSASERNSKLGSAEVELRLVEDCDTPTLPRFGNERR